MIQVDIFWSFAFGSCLAYAQQSTLIHEKDPFVNQPFVVALIWLAVCFAPSGIYLMWATPEWETMFGWGASYFPGLGTHNLQAGWVALFAATNTTQGILGWYLTYKRIRRRQDAEHLLVQEARGRVVRQLHFAEGPHAENSR